jgi:hypothetical protein
MSNQIGDRYSCSDPNCGCEIEIERPCNMLSSGSGPETGRTTEPAGTSSIRRDFRSEEISTPGDFGSQGATSEGNFGTVGRGDRSAAASGRYDTDSTRVREGVQTSGRTLTCFCGNEMRQVGTGKQKAQVRLRKYLAQLTSAGSLIFASTELNARSPALFVFTAPHIHSLGVIQNPPIFPVYM